MADVKKSLPLVPYLRQSKEKEQSISLDEQLRAIRCWAEKSGAELADPIVDKGVSGSTHWRERGLGEAIAACEDGGAQGIIVAFQDRLSRENGRATAEVWEALEKAGARFVAANEGLDTATGDHELLFTIKAAIAREQWKRFKKNWEDTRRALVRDGIHVTARVPVGYDRGPRLDDAGKPVLNKDGSPKLGALVPNADADAVRMLFRMRAAGARVSWATCARMMEEARCTPSGDGTRWTPRALSQVVKNRVYRGEIRYGSEFRADAHPAIVDPAAWRAAQVEVGEQGVRKAAPSLLRGIAHCAACGRRMGSVSGGTKAGARYRYMCRTNQLGRGECPAPASCYEGELDDLVERAFVVLIPQHYAAAPTVDTEHLELALADARSRYEAVLLTDLLSIDPAAFSRLALEAKAAVERAEDDLAAARAGSGLAREAGTIGQRWEGMGKEERTRWLALWGFRVDVARSERWGHPVEDRATLHWSPEPLHPETVVPATLADLFDDWKAA